MPGHTRRIPHVCLWPQGQQRHVKYIGVRCHISVKPSLGHDGVLCQVARSTFQMYDYGSKAKNLAKYKSADASFRSKPTANADGHADGSERWPSERSR